MNKMARRWKNRIRSTRWGRVIWRGSMVVLLGALLAGCGFVSEQDGPPLFSRLDPDNIPDAIPRAEPKSRYGNPPSYVVNGKRYHVLPSNAGHVERGLASWYGRKFHGRRTSSGETYDMFAMTAAHRSLPLPTYVRVTNLENNRQATVRVNDRGPFHPGRIIDLSYAAAVKLHVYGKGTAPVEIRVVGPPEAEGPGRAVGHPRPVPASPAVEENLYLQVGAFTSRTSAERLKVKLHATVDNAVSIEPTYNHGRTLYRVRLGPLADREQARRVVKRLSHLGLRDPRIHAD